MVNENTKDTVSYGADENRSGFPGDILRQGREDKGLSQEQVARDLNLMLRIINGLESGDFSSIRSPVFARGYIRSYSRYLGLDVEALVAVYDQELGDHDIAPRQILLLPESIDKNKANPSDIWVKLIGVFLVVLLFGGSWWWWQNQESIDNLEQLETSTSLNSQDESATISEVEPGLDIALLDQQIIDSDFQIDLTTAAGELNVDDVESLLTPATAIEIPAAIDNQVNNATDIANAATSTVAEPSNKQPTGVDQATNNTVESVTSPIELALGKGRLFISFTDDCWVEVRDSSGVVTISRVFSKFETVDVNVDAPVKVLLGRFSAVETFTFADKDIDLAPHTRKDIVRITLEL